MSHHVPECIHDYHLQDEHLHVNWRDAEVLEECQTHHVVVPICAYVNDVQAIILFFHQDRFQIECMALSDPNHRVELERISMLQYTKALERLVHLVQKIEK